MAGGGESGGGLLDLEKELSCSICTDILYQPLTLLDCLHTFCGCCSKEWFKWQADAAKTARRTATPYTCPSCRESVRGTKADWRLATLLEGYLKANPGKGKTAEEKEEMGKHYKPGDNVLPPVRVVRNEHDSDDERLMADIRELSMTNVDPETARRRAERSERDRQRRRQDRSQTFGSGRENSSWTAHRAQRDRDEDQRQVEHQPSLRSLLGSETSSQDVQEEILQSISSEGLLNGIDIDNLTLAQEEELTERIAEAYRRRQRNRERSRNRGRGRSEQSNRSPPTDAQRNESPARTQVRTVGTSATQQQQPRSRPPISRPHLFDATPPESNRRRHQRSASSTGQRDSRPETRDNASITAPAARSATDLSVNARTSDRDVPRPRATSSNNVRSSTDPAHVSENVRRVRATSGATLRPESASNSPRTREFPRQAPESGGTVDGIVHIQNSLGITPVLSHSDFAPEPTSTRSPPTDQISASTAALLTPTSQNIADNSTLPPSISCSRCERPSIQTSVHYHCHKCNNGNFNLCTPCYRTGKGCDHWFGFGFVPMHRWERAGRPGNEQPHVLTARKHLEAPVAQHDPSNSRTLEGVQEGAFCESCFKHANDCYWYCQICQDGAWGFCNACVLSGKHCTHPLLPLAHISTLGNSTRHDPAKLAFIPVPHLREHSYVLLPVLTDCDICRIPIPSNRTRYHCYTCSVGDYDICNECYNSLVTTGKISAANGPGGWRRCPQGHRMAVIGYQETPYGGGHVRVTIRGAAGGWRLREEGPQSGVNIAPPPDGGGGLRYLAQYGRFPGEDVQDELSFPRNAEICEGEDLTAEWAIGVYAGVVKLFPRNHARRL